jgi:hypothetical protein
VKFFLGTHQPGWLAHAGVPLFVSHRRLARYRRLPVAVTDWALDSGGFTELSLYGRWATTAARYAAAVRRYRDEIGHLAWCAPQDWKCEPQILARTGRSVPAHQRATVAGYVHLRDLAPDLPVIPVLQGWAVPGDYLRCAELYAAAGIDLTAEPLVGLGSVCRRQASADSLAWSQRGRHVPGCRHRPWHGRAPVSEANCLGFALEWRAALLARLPSAGQVAEGRAAA